MAYHGKATTVGNSRALSFEATLFKAHPEFAAGRFEAHVIAPDTMLVTSAEPARESVTQDEDPIVLAYLAFLEEQRERHAELIQPMDELLPPVQGPGRARRSGPGRRSGGGRLSALRSLRAVKMAGASSPGPD